MLHIRKGTLETTHITDDKIDMKDSLKIATTLKKYYKEKIDNLKDNMMPQKEAPIEILKN